MVSKKVFDGKQLVTLSKREKMSIAQYLFVFNAEGETAQSEVYKVK